MPSSKASNQPRTDYSKLRQTSKYHTHWRTIPTYTATYKAGKRGKGKQTLIVRTLNKPPPLTKEFRLAGDTLKLFTRTQLTKTTKEVIIIMATKEKTTKTRKKPIEEQSDLEKELEGLEELSEDADGDGDSSSSDESTDAGDETEGSKKSKKDKKSKKAKDKTDDDADADDDGADDVEKPKKGKKDKKKKSTRAKANGKIGTQEIAAEAGCDARTLRMVLRKHEIEKDAESGRYEWDSLEDAEVKKILKLIKEGAAAEVKKEGLDKLKAKKDAEKKDKKSKKDKKKNKKAKDEDDE